MKTWKGCTRIAAAAALLAAIASPLFAAGMKGPCAADAERLCQSVPHDRPHIIQCLHAHSGELSEPCKQHMQGVEAETHNRRQACQADIDKFCKDPVHGRGHFFQCLQAHEADLSPACKNAMGAPPVKP